ncbi:hypothetical protein FXF51_56680 [Nonomuraea sp. PA05]|uniref:hypothetical protein n=1 Tax=Nonomuraea sp. PA05 TaxID=2604466 RepID=UPI0011D38A28|nr:hypothetical protein [Nonomuraea sp. PA05]TYB50218.1 hypothetical protein FXF51_56680 [Nonomuraea sp. PA05]
MIRTVYVVTTAPGGRGRAVRAAAALLAARLVFLLAWLGHAVVLAAGALDAIVCAWLGVPRTAVFLRRFRAVLNETWEADL